MSEPAASVILDFPELPRRVFQRPGAVLQAHTIEQVSSVLQQAEQAARAGKYVIGFVTYEAAPAFDSALRVKPLANRSSVS